MAAIKRPVLRYYGGKWKIAPWIISHFPPHRVYSEPYGGGGSVLLRKPRSHAEIYNDMSGEVVNVFRVLRDPAQAQELERVVTLTPFAREEFLLSYIPHPDPVEQARRTLVRAYCGYGTAAIGKTATGFKMNANTAGVVPAQEWRNYPAAIVSFTERMRGVCIENYPAIDMMIAQDCADCLHYVDPPYPKSTRSSNSDCYEHEMTDQDHQQLATVLYSLTGMVILSGYACDLYDRDLYVDWMRVERNTVTNGDKKRTEVLWLNPAAANRQQHRMNLT